MLSAIGAAASHSQAPAALWLDVPYFHQPTDGCGAASIAMVMHYWADKQKMDAGRAADMEAIQTALYSPKQHGIEASAMQRYFQEHGYQVFPIQGRWSDLHEQLSKGRPLIVAIKPEDQRQLHYVVVDGVDNVRGTVTMNDPAVRKLLTEERAQFEKDWSATHNWLLLAVPSATQSR